MAETDVLGHSPTMHRFTCIRVNVRRTLTFTNWGSGGGSRYATNSAGPDMVVLPNSSFHPLRRLAPLERYLNIYPQGASPHLHNNISEWRRRAAPART